jgi:alkyl hydroperoxide reductase subunit AhpC
MLDLNADAPPFALEGVEGDAVRRFALADFRGRWLVLFFYPADFSFVCPTEVVGFQKRLPDFGRLGAAVVGVSTDDVASHRAWATELGGVTYPLLADPAREVSRGYGVLNAADGRAYRATVIVSPDGKIAYQVVSPMNVGRSVDETMRVLEALQTGKMCPADWKPGEPTLDPSLRY